MWYSIIPVALVWLAVVVCTVPCHATDAATLGGTTESEMGEPQTDACPGGVLVYNHDDSFENGYCWQYSGVSPPYYGAFAEAFDLGCGVAVCGSYWFTQIGYGWLPVDVYVWQGGLGQAPGDVICLVPNVTGLSVPFWPACGRNDVEIGCDVSGEFSIGYWTNYAYEACGLWICADENGPDGCPWTCIAPGIGYPSGWQHANVAYPDAVSLGIGAFFEEEPSPTTSGTWGAMKALLR
jgi:hypothetical protein